LEDRERRVEEWKNGRMERKNVNRGFRQLRVWNNSVELYILTFKLLAKFPFELKKTSSNCIDSSHSISRNIAEGYSRRSLKEYLNIPPFQSSIRTIHQPAEP